MAYPSVKKLETVLHEDMFNNGLDIVVIARSTARNISYHETESALLHLGGLHKVINR